MQLALRADLPTLPAVKAGFGTMPIVRADLTIYPKQSVTVILQNVGTKPKTQDTP